MSYMAINPGMTAGCGNDFSRLVDKQPTAPWTTKVAPTKTKQEALT
jgi:hypothetical protein